MKPDFEFCCLQDLADFEMGQSPNSDFVNDRGFGVPFLQGCAEFGSEAPTHVVFCSQPKKKAQVGDILMSVRAPVGTLNKADRDYCIGRGLAAIRFKDAMIPSLGWHVLNYWAPNLRKVAQGSTFEAIGQEELKRLQVLKIPPEEQQAIAHILDTIDEAIATTTALIDKLKLAKAGLLHDLLTRGIDENGELRDPTRHPEQFKDSELGLIPKAWDALPLGTVIANIDAGKSPNCPDRPAITGEWGVLKVSAVHPAGFKSDENKAVTNPIHIKPEYEVKSEDLLITRANTYELVGLSCFVKSPPPNLLICDKTLRLNPFVDKVYKAFLNYTLQMSYVRTAIQNNATGSSAGMKNISQKMIRSLVCLIPRSLDEQILIVNSLNSCEVQIVVKQNRIKKLKLLKQGLMSDLLTGRVRVKIDSSEAG